MFVSLKAEWVYNSSKTLSPSLKSTDRLVSLTLLRVIIYDAGLYGWRVEVSLLSGVAEFTF